jgi:multidrug efflux pump subunit AcrB
MLSAIFVDRPRLAIVIAIVTTIAGLISLYALPLAHIQILCRHRCR